MSFQSVEKGETSSLSSSLWKKEIIQLVLNYDLFHMGLN